MDLYAYPKYSSVHKKTWQDTFLYEPISDRSRMFQKIFAQIWTWQCPRWLDQEEDAKYVLFECPTYCRYSPNLHGPQETIENMISSDERSNQVENLVTNRTANNKGKGTKHKIKNKLIK